MSAYSPEADIGPLAFCEYALTTARTLRSLFPPAGRAGWGYRRPIVERAHIRRKRESEASLRSD